MCVKYTGRRKAQDRPAPLDTPTSSQEASMPADEPTTCGIYQIRCLANGKVYVGSAVNFRARWTNHRSALVKGSHHSPRLQRAWRKYGADQFVFEVLEVVLERTGLLVVEQQWLDKLRPFEETLGYNMASVAEAPGTGLKHSAESRAKRSVALKGRSFTDETRAKMSASGRGRIMTPEARANMSIGQKGRETTPETRLKLSTS